MLSKAGKEILIKLVAQAIPNYIMQVYRLPNGILAEIEAMLGRFWWGSQNGKSRGIHWSCWDSLSFSKGNGGLGFRRLSPMNLALLAKTGWRLMINPTSLLARVLKAKYYPNGEFLEAPIGYRPSFLWSSIHATHDIIRKGAIYRIGNGENTRVLQDPWLPCSNLFIVTPPPSGWESLRVSALINS